jgi:Nif-specific regulatory protein
VTATNRNLEEAVKKGTFRADLYYRISVVAIMVPPLRDRRSDIPLLATEFLQRFNRDNKTTRTLSKSAVDVLSACYFPGNVRELENCVRRTATMAEGDVIKDADFACRNDHCLSSVLWTGSNPSVPDMAVPLPVLPTPTQTRPDAPLPVVARPTAPPPVALDWPPIEVSGDDGEDRHEGQIVDREPLIAAMQRSGWVKAKAARLLGVTPRQVGYAIRKHGIEVPKF